MATSRFEGCCTITIQHQPMFKKILIANRGEIAIRIIRACQDLGIGTVAIFSDADRASLHVRYADEAYYVGAPPSIDSYLNSDRILTAAKTSGAEAIHPGYGFLSESPSFAQKCQELGVVYIGPSPEVIEKMSNKILARQIMMEHNVPVIPGGSEDLQDYSEALTICQDIGFPVMLKAVSGGGGKGMRIVKDEKSLNDAFHAVRREAYASFADGRIFLEKYFESARHIEVQIFADSFANTIHLHERECSIQRRYQKVIEESPSPFVDDELRQKITSAAITAARSVGYIGAGTVEFLVDQEKSFYFLEMNTRIQVEHSITEMVTGFDMVKEQITVAAGEKLTIQQEDVKSNGWAIECRIYAEDPAQGYLPATGLIKKMILPEGPGVRVDNGIYTGWSVSHYYDPMLVKLAVWGSNREEARQRMLRALEECVIHGLKTNLSLHKLILKHPKFIAGDINTAFIEECISVAACDDPAQHDLAIIAAICASSLCGEQPDSEGHPEANKQDQWRMANKYQFWASRF